MQSDLVQPAVFTGKFEISEDLWNQICDKYKRDQTEPSAQLYLIKSIEKLFEVRQEPKLLGINCKVACVKLEFNNYEIINLLQQKAELLNWGKAEQANQLRDQIN